MRPLRALVGVAVLVILVGACATGNRASTDSSEEPSATPDRLVLGAGVHRVPFQIDHGRPIPTVDVLVNGRGPYRFMCDIGSSVTVLGVDLAHSLELALVSTEPLRDPLGAPGVPAWKAELDTLQIGDVRWGGVPVVATTARNFDFGHDIQGVLGLPLFDGCLVTLDYPNKELRVERGRLDASIDAGFVPYHVRGSLPEITLVANRRTIPACIDIGSTSGFTLPKQLALELGLDSEPHIVGRGRTMDGEFDVWASKLSGSILFGGHEYRSPEVHLTAYFHVANIGHAVLSDFAVTIDRAHHYIRFVFRESRDEKK